MVMMVEMVLTMGGSGNGDGGGCEGYQYEDDEGDTKRVYCIRSATDFHS